MLGEREYIKSNTSKDFQILKLFLLLAVLINLSVFVSQGNLWQPLSLSFQSIVNLQLWTPLSSIFLAAPNGIIAFVFDILIFYYAGKRIEDVHGEYKLRYLIKYLLLTLIICLPILFIYFPHQHLYFFSSFMVGVVCAYSWYFYKISTRFYVFFILPVDLKGKHILLLIALYVILISSQTPHLFVQFGAIFVCSWFLCNKKDKMKIKKKIKVKTRKAPQRNEIQKGFRLHVKEDLADPEVDAILDKILAEGIESLSDEEKRKLESKSEKNN